ncbi:MAG: hypothetical protein ACTSUF_07720 [Candidatus Heimdallarchaeaceae archaeon]
MTDKGYTTEEKIEKYLNITITTDDADDFILATQKYIDEMTGRSFKADESASARLYNGNSRQGLIIDDCVEVTKVEVGSNIWGDSFEEISNDGSTRYYTLPANNEAENLPIRKIGLRDRIWIEGHANHKITAKWGFSEEVPSDVSFAATVIASGMYYENRGGKSGKVGMEKIGQYQVSYGDEKKINDLAKAQEILDNYTKHLL